ncbi:bifunctional diguanylate cyclase/phosphodiesterase [Clostridioides difficile]
MTRKGKENSNIFLEINNLNGVIISIDKVSKKVNLFGNIRGMFGVNEKQINISIEQFVQYIDKRYISEFEFLLDRCNDSTTIDLKLDDKCLSEAKWIRVILNGVIIENNVTKYEGYINDVTYHYDKTIHLENTFCLDELTGLHKRAYIKDKIDSYLENNKNSNIKSALIMLGLDNFKYINDSFGVIYGDSFLKTIAKELKNNIVSDNLICRFEGDEFLIFLHNVTGLTDIEKKVQLISSIVNKSYNINNKSIYVTTSIGVSVYPEHGDDFNKLLKSADSAMYIAKTKGKNRYQLFNENISKEMDRYYKIQNQLMNAIENNEMYVVFQPKVILAHDKVNGFEALIRWNNKELGHVSPNEFISVAEANGLILPIGNFVLREVFKKIQVLLNSGYCNFKIAVNLSDIQLRDKSLVEYVKKLCSECNTDGRYIEFEITESILIKSYDDTLESLYNLKQLGATIALDDFGTGYSSLNYLTKLPIDTLKIDRSFIIDMIENHKSRWIIENIIELSHKLGIEVVAEGVELEEQVDYLKSILCDIVQGYFYSKPESFEKVVDLLEK